MRKISSTTQKKPYIIVTIGPTGAGKSSLPNLIIEELGLDEDYVNIQIDDLVQTNYDYKKGMNKLMRNKGIHANLKNNNLLKKLNNNLGSHTTMLYFDVRMHRCGGQSCNVVNDNLLTDAIKHKRNIVIESMGNKNIDWLFKFLGNTYTVIISYMILDYNTLIERIKTRALRGFRQYFEQVKQNPSGYRTNASVVGPRYPSTSNEQFGPIVNLIYSILMNLICTLNGIARPFEGLPDLYTQGPDGYGVDYLYIYDNKQTPSLQYRIDYNAPKNNFGNATTIVNKIRTYMPTHDVLYQHRNVMSVRTKVNKNTKLSLQASATRKRRVI